MTISRDEAERMRLMSEYKNKLDIQSELVYARRTGLKEGRDEGRQEGLAEGRAEGRQEGLEKGLQEGRTNEKIEIARNMVKIGLPVETIASVTGLDIQTITSLIR
jgi:predicted transposase YdaD